MDKLTLEAYYMGRDTVFKEELTEELRSNAADLLRRVNDLVQVYCQETGNAAPGLRSGWRPADINGKVPGAAKKSNHIKCNAVDLADAIHKFATWCLSNLDLLKLFGLWMESPECTATWTHLQRVPPKSGHRVFIA